MIDYSKAKKILRKKKIKPGIQILNASRTYNRVNAQNIYSKVN